MNTDLECDLLNQTDWGNVHTMIFIAPEVALRSNWNALGISHGPQRARHFELSSYQNGAQQIATILSQCPNLKAVHIHTIGEPGWLMLGSVKLTAANMERYSWELQSWFAHVPSYIKPSLLLCGCNVGDGYKGIEFIDKLHRLTGCHIRCTESSTPRHLQLI